MKIKKYLILVLAFLITACSSSNSSFDITVSNDSDFERIDEFIELSIDQILEKHPQFNVKNFSVYDGEQEIAYQVINRENGGTIVFVCNIEADQNKTIQIKFSEGENKKEYTSRVFAGLAPKKGNIYYEGKFRGSEFQFVDKFNVPVIHKDHDALFKCEGPVWESDLVGYRFYLDWRNATDIFGKKVNDLVLREAGQHDTVANNDSYHNMQTWGMDIFKVGSTLGIGSIAMMYDGKVSRVEKTDSNYFEMKTNGPIQAEFITTYNGWEVGTQKYNLDSYTSINAGSRLTKQTLVINNDAQNLSTGLAKYKGTNFIEKKNAGQWSCIALYGKQTLVDENDELGIVLFYNDKDLIEITEDDINNIVVLKPTDNMVSYYYAAAWVQEPSGIKNENEFISYIEKEIIKLNNPVKIELK